MTPKEARLVHLEDQSIIRNPKTMDEFTLEYMICALWSSLDDDGEPLDATYELDDIEDPTVLAMKVDCERFQSENIDMIRHDLQQAGHDFWLSRNGHGAGFFDGKWGADCDTLQDAAEAFGEVNLWASDGGVYV